jgi:hypothetical protein
MTRERGDGEKDFDGKYNSRGRKFNQLEQIEEQMLCSRRNNRKFAKEACANEWWKEIMMLRGIVRALELLPLRVR